jgi:hypothetical protein
MATRGSAQVRARAPAPRPGGGGAGTASVVLQRLRDARQCGRRCDPSFSQHSSVKIFLLGSGVSQLHALENLETAVTRALYGAARTTARATRRDFEGPTLLRSTDAASVAPADASAADRGGGRHRRVGRRRDQRPASAASAGRAGDSWLRLLTGASTGAWSAVAGATASGYRHYRCGSRRNPHRTGRPPSRPHHRQAAAARPHRRRSGAMAAPP